MALRFILRRKLHDAHSGATHEGLFTIDAEVPELERALDRGGYGAGQGYDLTELVGVEVRHEGAVDASQQIDEFDGDAGRW